MTKVKLFYGWYIVFASLILTTFYSAIFVYGWTAFLNPIIKTFDWSVAQISFASSIYFLETGIMNPAWGIVVDRWSPKKLMLFGVIVTGLGLFCLSLTTNLAIYYTGFCIMGLGSSLILGILPTTMIARWFRRDIGKANGVFFMGLGIGGVMVPIVVKIIDKLTWQSTLLYSAIGFVVIGIPLAFIYRNRPEDYGMVPDGKKSIIDGVVPAIKYNFGTGVKQALKMRAFWQLNLVSLFQNATIITVTNFVIPYMTNLGMSRSNAGMVVSIFTLVSLFSRIPLGMSADVFKKKYVITLTLGLLAVSLFVFWAINIHSPFWLILLFCVTYGLGMSGINVLRAPIQAEYFGTRNFGTIFGLNSIATTIGAVAAMPLTGWVFDTYHSYKPFWFGLAIFAVIAIISMLTIPPAPKNTESASRIG